MITANAATKLRWKKFSSFLERALEGAICEKISVIEQVAKATESNITEASAPILSQASSFFRMNSAACFGSALPCDIFITWPQSQPSTFVLPLL